MKDLPIDKLHFYETYHFLTFLRLNVSRIENNVSYVEYHDLSTKILIYWWKHPPITLGVKVWEVRG